MVQLKKEDVAKEEVKLKKAQPKAIRAQAKANRLSKEALNRVLDGVGGVGGVGKVGGVGGLLRQGMSREQS